MINEQKIIYMETEGWGVISGYKEIIAIGASYTIGDITVYPLDFTDSSDWLDGNGDFAYIGSTFVITDNDGNRGRYMCIGQDLVNNYYLFVYVDGVTTAETLSLDYFIRLEDSYKICTRIPDWVTGEDARKRWMPIIADIDSTLSTQVKPEGGLSPTSGLLISCVHDLTYNSYSKDSRIYQRLETMLSQDPTVNYASAVSVFGEDLEFQVSKVISRSADTMTVQQINGVNLDEFGIYDLIEDEYIEIPWLNLEPINIISRTTATLYAIERALNNTVKLTHPIGTAVFKRLPSFQGSSVTVYETNNSNFYDFTTLYFGLVENINFTEKLTGFDIEISSNIFTPRISSLQQRTPTTIKRTGLEEDVGLSFSFPEEQAFFPDMPETVPGGEIGDTRGNFFGRFRAFQNNPEDVFSWIRIGNVAIKAVRTYIPFENNEPLVIGTDRLAAYGFERSLESRESYVLEQKVTGRTYVTYFVPPFFVTRDDTTGIYTSPYSRYEERYNNTNMIQLANIQEDVISIYEEQLFLLRATRIDSTGFPFSRDMTALAEDYLRKEKVSLIHLFEKAGSTADDLMGNPYESNLLSADVRGYYNRVHVVDILLQILTSTGGGLENGPWDLIPSEISFGINLSKIDLESFFNFSATNKDLTVSNFYIDVEKGDPASFMIELLEDNFLALSQGYDGRIRLVDLTALAPDVNNAATDYTDYLLASSGVSGFDIEMSYEAANISNTVGFTWKEPWRRATGIQRNITVEVSPGASLREDGNVQASITNIYDRLKSRPINFDLKYAPTGNSSLLIQPQYPVTPAPPITSRGGKYLSLYKKPVPILTVSILIDPNVPTLQVGNLFKLTGVELVGTDGNVLGKADSITCFVTDAQYNYINKVSLIKATIISFINLPTISRWHIAGKINEIIFASPDYELFIDGTFGVSSNNSFYPPLDRTSFERDIQQFSVGDTLVLLDENWVEKTTFVVDSIDYDNDQIVSDDPALSAAVVGDIVMANLVSSVNSIYAESLIGVNSLRINR